jgi:hypothetical protein
MFTIRPMQQQLQVIDVLNSEMIASFTLRRACRVSLISSIYFG